MQVVYNSENLLTLELILFVPVSISMSCIAKLESARLQGTIDLDLGRQLLGDKGASAEDVLRETFRAINFEGRLVPAALEGSEAYETLRPICSLAMFLALLDKDVRVGYKWMKANRLSLFSIPQSKMAVYERLQQMMAKEHELGFTKQQMATLKILTKKLAPLEGK